MTRRCLGHGLHVIPVCSHVVSKTFLQGVYSFIYGVGMSEVLKYRWSVGLITIVILQGLFCFCFSPLWSTPQGLI